MSKIRFNEPEDIYEAFAGDCDCQCFLAGDDEDEEEVEDW